MKLPRNVYRKGTGYRGQRVVDGERYVTTTQRTPELALAELERMLAGQPADCDTTADPHAMLSQVIEQSERTTQMARRALLAIDQRLPRQAPADTDDSSEDKSS